MILASLPLPSKRDNDGFLKGNRALEYIRSTCEMSGDFLTLVQRLPETAEFIRCLSLEAAKPLLAGAAITRDDIVSLSLCAADLILFHWRLKFGDEMGSEEMASLLTDCLLFEIFGVEEPQVEKEDIENGSTWRKRGLYKYRVAHDECRVPTPSHLFAREYAEISGGEFEDPSDWITALAIAPHLKKAGEQIAINLFNNRKLDSGL